MIKKFKSLENLKETEFCSDNFKIKRNKSLSNIHFKIDLSWFKSHDKSIKFTKSLNNLNNLCDNHSLNNHHSIKMNKYSIKICDDSNLPKSISSDLFNILMKYEKNRLRTFRNWPSKYITPQELSKAGFYYLLKNDYVKCFECKLILSDWKLGDEAILGHYQNNPKCRLLNGYDVGNIAIDQTPLDILKQYIDLEEFDPVDGNENIINYFNDLDDDDDEELIDELNQNCLKYESQQSYTQDHKQSFNEIDLFELMKSEEKRLKTFDTWPNELMNYVKPTDLAQCGFFYTTIKDKVICAFCRIPAWDWAKTDVPIKEHYKHNLDCPLLNDLDCGNKPIKNIKFKELLLEYQDIAPSNYSSSGEDDTSFLRTMRQSSNQNQQIYELMNQNNLNELITKHKPVDKYTSYDERLDTFKNWPLNTVMKTTLASAGFYYLGINDQVKCYSCNLILNNWSEEDDPLTEHCKYNRNCEFLILSKGNDFITRNLKNSPNKGSNKVICGSTASSASSSSSSDVEHENEGFINFDDDTKNICKICMTNSADIVYLPCKHLVSCASCTIAMKDCPLCKSNILSTMKVYIG